MTRTNFRISHSIFTTVVLLVLEYGAVRFLGAQAALAAVLALAAVGAVAMIYVATEAIEEVRGKRALFLMLTAVTAQFILFFAFQHWFILTVQPGSFPLGTDPSSLLLASVMAFVFNPFAAPTTAAARTLLLIDTFGSLGLVLFALQNINELRRKSLDDTR